MAGVMPKQMIRPTPRFAIRVGIGASEEIGLRVHLLNLEFPGDDAVVHPLVRGVEPSHMIHHGNDTGLLLQCNQRLRVREIVRHGNLDHHVLAGSHHPARLLRVDRRRRGQNGRFHTRLCQGLIEVQRDMRNTARFSHRFHGFLYAPADGNHFDVVDPFDRVQVLVRESAFANHADLQSMYSSPAAANGPRMS